MVEEGGSGGGTASEAPVMEETSSDHENLPYGPESEANSYVEAALTFGEALCRMTVKDWARAQAEDVTASTWIELLERGVEKI